MFLSSPPPAMSNGKMEGHLDHKKAVGTLVAKLTMMESAL